MAESNRKTLRKAILDVLDYGDLKQVLAEGTPSRHLDKFVSPTETFDQQVFQLIDRAEKDGWIHDLVETLLAARNGNQMFVARLQPILSRIAQGQPLDDDAEESPRVSDAERYPDSTKMLLEKQRRFVLRTPLFLSSVTVSVPRLEFVIPQLLVPPRLRNVETAQTISANELPRIARSADGLITAVIGPSGSGKSFTLVSELLSLQKLWNEQGDVLPVLITPHIALAGAASLDAMLKSFASYHDCPEASLSNQRITFLLDGLDELGGETARTVIRNALSHPRRQSIIIACRVDFYLRELAIDRAFVTKLESCWEVLPWRLNESNRFAEQFLEKTKSIDQLPFLKSSLAAQPYLAQLAQNPLQLTLVLLLLVRNGPESLQSIRTLFRIYSDFFTLWMEHETTRKRYEIPRETIEWVHQELAQVLELNRGNYIRLDKFVSELEKRGLDSACREVLMTDDRLLNLVSFSKRGPFTEISRYQHESLGDFLCARHAVALMRSTDHRLESELLNTYNREVCEFLEQALTELTKQEVRAIRSFLGQLYRTALTAATGKNRAPITDADRIYSALREQYLYYLGRLPSLAPASEVMRDAYQLDPDPVTRRTAAISGILQGDGSLEFAYLDALDSDREADLINRSVDLIYYADRADDPRVFLDDGTNDWERTRSAFLGRLSSTREYDARLRWFDLRSLKRFAISRSEFRFSTAERNIIAACDTMGRPEIEQDRNEIIQKHC